MITPFIDPLTREKLKFNDNMRNHVPPEQLWNEFHGDLEFEYDHAIYWPVLMKLCKEKQVLRRERWIKGGKHCGESENYLKGGTEPSVGSVPSEGSTTGTEDKANTAVPTASNAASDVHTEAADAEPAGVGINHTHFHPPVSHASGNLEVAAKTEDQVSTA